MLRISSDVDHRSFLGGLKFWGGSENLASIFVDGLI